MGIRTKTVLATVAGLVALGITAALIVVFGGWYNVAATSQHLRATYWALDIAMREAVQRRSRDIVVPPLDDPALIARGLALYREQCVRCHGAPGVAPESFALGLKPAPANLAFTARAWPPGELYWVVKHGIKMAGMPAFEFRLADDELWALVAFVEQLPRLSPREYQALQVPSPAPADAYAANHPADARRGRLALDQYACTTCHRIPGVIGAGAPVGPPLDGMGSRAVIAGLMTNTSENMVRWLREPQLVNPDSAMPDLGVSERDARDMAAYLLGLK